MQLPARATGGQRLLKLRESHGPLWLDQTVGGSILAEIEVGTQVTSLDVPYRIAAYAAKTGWPTVLGQSERIVGSDRHASLTRQHRIRRVDGKDIRCLSVAGPNAKHAAAWPDRGQSILNLLHAAIEPHPTLGGNRFCDQSARALAGWPGGR
jgi:hypothetical protein